ncbi:MAG: Fe-S cluster assembly protein SufD [Pseudoclavibacter sp.]|nr:Fe-S cluster assembly protein SufD [Pseudoclavibacter sp.]
MTTSPSAPAAAQERDALGRNRHSHGQTGSAPVQTRSERPRSFDPADFAGATGREAEWRYAPLERLRPLMADEPGDGSLQHRVTAPEGVLREPLAAGEAPRGRAFAPEDLPSAVAWKHGERALFLSIPAGRELQEPVRVHISGAAGAGRDLAHIVVRAEPNSRATVILQHEGPARYLQNVEILVEEGARLQLVAVHEWDEEAVHLGAHQANVGRDAFLKHVVVSLGGAVVRVNPSIRLDARGADAEAYGLYFSDAGQHLEHQVYIDHAAADTRSRVNYKGALQGASARSVWIGDVLIRPEAEGTDSYEQNRNLVLSDGARADSVPNLEIETGQIEGAGHASATGRFDDEQLFYLMARGISEGEARRLVVHGFLNEIVQEIPEPALREHLQERLGEELERSTSRLLQAGAGG